MKINFELILLMGMYKEQVKESHVIFINLYKLYNYVL